MADTKDMILKLIAIILLAIVGFYIQWKNILGEHGKDNVSALLNRVALPFLIVSSFWGVKLGTKTMINALYIVVFALVFYLINWLYAKAATKHYRLVPEQTTVFISGTVHANAAFLAFPLLYALLGEIGLFYGTVYYLVDTILLFTIGLKRLTSNHEKTSNKIAPATIALIIGVVTMVIATIVNFDLSQTIFYSTVHDLGSMTTPLAFLFIGMIVADSDIKKLLVNRPAINLIIFKQVLLPIAFIVFFLFFKGNFETLLILVMMVEVLMPSFASLLAMSHEYRQDVSLAASLVVLGHLFAMISIPILFTIVTILFK